MSRMGAMLHQDARPGLRWQPSGGKNSNNGTKMPATVYFTAEEILRKADALFRAEQSQDLASLVAEKAKEIRRYDVLAMNRVVAVEAWGRSGSVLLASYLDAHEDVIMLPALRSDAIYGFFQLYGSLTLQQKLTAYPAFVEQYDAQSEGAGCGRSFFTGAFAVSRMQYYASVKAICEAADAWPQDFVNSHRALFISVHIAYNVALGRRPASATPLIVSAQHGRDDERAARFVEEFPEAKFIHTVRDPISSFERLFDWFFDPTLLPDRQPLSGTANALHPARYISLLAPLTVLDALIEADRPHPGTESRTLAVRFEDMHCNLADTMRELAAWLDICYQTTLVESTFNGIPYVVTRDGQSWSGSRPDKTQRQVRNLSLKDRALLYALFYEDFLAWKYPCPKIFGSTIVRTLVLFIVPFLPMKMELIVARAALKRRVLPWLRRGNVSVPIDSLLRIAYCRLALLWLLLRSAPGRLAHRRTPLELHRGGNASLSGSFADVKAGTTIS